MDQNQICHDLLQRMQERERMIEHELRNYPHRQALREAQQTMPTRHRMLAARVGEWLRNRFPGFAGPTTVHVNLHIAVVYAGPGPVGTGNSTSAGELIYGNERVEWNHVIDAVKTAVQNKLNKSRDKAEAPAPVAIFVR